MYIRVFNTPRTNQIRVVESFIRVKNETSVPGQERNVSFGLGTKRVIRLRNETKRNETKRKTKQNKTSGSCQVFIRVVESFIRVRNEMKNKTSGSCQVFIRVKNETSNPGQKRNETKRNEKQNIRVPGLVKSLSGLRPKPVNRVRNETISGLLLFKTMTQVYYI